MVMEAVLVTEWVVASVATTATNQPAVTVSRMMEMTSSAVGVTIISTQLIHSKNQMISAQFNPVLIPPFCRSQSSSPDNWGGFENKTTNVQPRGSTTDNGNHSRRSSKPTSAVTTPDFEAIDVKSQRPKSGAAGANKTKKIEDDAWDLLNN